MPVSYPPIGTSFVQTAVICGALTYFGKRQAASIIALSFATQALAGFAQVLILRNEKICDANNPPTKLPTTKGTLIGKSFSVVESKILKAEEDVVEAHKTADLLNRITGGSGTFLISMRTSSLKQMKEKVNSTISTLANWKSLIKRGMASHGVRSGIALATVARAFQLQRKVTVTQMALPILLSALTAIFATFYTYKNTPVGETNGWNDRIIRPIDHASIFAFIATIISLVGVITFRYYQGEGN